MQSGTSVCRHTVFFTHLLITLTELGVPFNDTSDFRFQIAEISEAVLGDNLLGLQAGNEPDLYGSYACFPIARPLPQKLIST